MISRKTLAKRLLSVVMSVVMLLAVCTMFPQIEMNVSASGVDNIVARADYLYNLTWTAQTDVKGWRNQYTFYEGETHRIPYGQPATDGKYVCFGVSIEDFLAAAADASSIFYTTQSYYSGNSGSYSTYYAMDCSAFVSYCWGISRTTTGNWSSLDVTSYGLCNSTNASNIQIGDALCRATPSSKRHIVLVTDLEYDANGAISRVEITEQTPPEIARSYYTLSDLASNYSAYTIYRYNKRDSVPEAPVSKVTEAPIVTTAHKYYVPNAEISVNWTTSAGATGYWLDLYKNGEHILTQNLGNVNTYTAVYDEGIYEVLITAYSENGGWSAVTSEGCLFIVEDVTAPTVSTAAKYYVPNAEISVNWSTVESATGYWLDIYKNGEHVYTGNVGNITSYTDKYETGEYGVFVTAFNENGGWSAATSGVYNFYVGEITAPTVYSDSKYYVSNSQIVLSWESVASATGYWLDIYKNDEHIYTGNIGNVTSHTDIFENGEYGIFVTAFNENGGWSAATSDVYRFYVYTPADLNSDGSVTILDLTLLQKYLLDLRSFTPLQFTTADINSDGSVNAFDLALLKQILLTQ